MDDALRQSLRASPQLMELGRQMRAFLLAVLTAFVLAGLASFVLDRFQSSSDVANTTTGARVDFAKDGIGARPH